MNALSAKKAFVHPPRTNRRTKVFGRIEKPNAHSMLSVWTFSRMKGLSASNAPCSRGGHTPPAMDSSNLLAIWKSTTMLMIGEPTVHTYRDSKKHRSIGWQVHKTQ